MVKLVVPVFVQDEFVGAVGGCGLLLEDTEVDAFAIYKITGLDEESVELLGRNVPPITIQKAKETVAFIEKELEAILTVYNSRH